VTEGRGIQLLWQSGYAIADSTISVTMTMPSGAFLTVIPAIVFHYQGESDYLVWQFPVQPFQSYPQG
jgi:hypothetical protein